VVRYDLKVTVGQLKQTFETKVCRQQDQLYQDLSTLTSSIFCRHFSDVTVHASLPSLKTSPFLLISCSYPTCNLKLILLNTEMFLNLKSHLNIKLVRIFHRVFSDQSRLEFPRDCVCPLRNENDVSQSDVPIAPMFIRGNATQDVCMRILKRKLRQMNTVDIPLLDSWTSLKEDYIAFLLPVPKCTNCIKQVLMLELSKIDS
jgi:hypothetical protein